MDGRRETGENWKSKVGEEKEERLLSGKER